MQLPPNNNVDESTRALSPKSPYQDLNTASQPVGDQMLTKLDENTKVPSLNSPNHDIKPAFKHVADQTLPEPNESIRIPSPNNINTTSKPVGDKYLPQPIENTKALSPVSPNHDIQTASKPVGDQNLYKPDLKFISSTSQKEIDQKTLDTSKLEMAYDNLVAFEKDDSGNNDSPISGLKSICKEVRESIESQMKSKTNHAQPPYSSAFDTYCVE